MAGTATAILDRLAERYLARIGGGMEADRHEVVALRHLVICFALPLFLVPGILAFLLSPAVALPLGVAVVVAAFLVTSVVVIALARLPASRQAETRDEESLPLDLCPGLMLVLDSQGHVQVAGGRDRDVFMPFLRDAFRRPFVEQVHVSDRIALASQLDELRQGADAAVVDIRLERPLLGLDQSQFMNVRVDMTGRRNDEGQLQSVVVQLLDIETELAIRSDAARVAAEAEQANEAKTRFLAAVSHELRTPLNAILGFSDILRGEYFGALANDRQREYVQLIHQSGAHLLSVVNAMLDMSKIEAGRYELMLEPFDIARTVADCENMLALQAREKGVVLTSRIGRGLSEVVADQRAIRQVLINLVGNALKFTDTGGSVIIDAVLDGADLKLSVSDTGIGIAADKIALLGQPFTQIQSEYNRRYEGSGLGLSLVKGLTALHGGSFAITSQPGEGTVVTVTLPADGSGAAEIAAGGASSNTVEFPPRLGAAPAASATVMKDVGLHDAAKAKTA